MIPRFATLALVAAWSLVTLAAPPTAPKGVKVEADVPYVPNGDAAQVLDVYTPEQASDKPLPLIVYVHGGGWHAGSKAGCPAKGLVTQGYVVASVEYRFSQKALFPAQIQDCQAALRFLRANAKKYNLDPAHVAAWGESAGGHLVALMGTSGGTNAFAKIGGNDGQSDRVQAVVDLYGPTDFNTVIDQAAAQTDVQNIFKWNTANDPYGQLIGGGLGVDKAKGDAVSPTHYVSKESAPILILHGTKDRLVPFAQSVELADLLKKDGVPVWLQRLPGADHGGPAFGLPGVRNLVKNFLDKELKGADVKVELLPDDQVTVPPAAPKPAAPSGK
jgi:acetyl esterase/lipase